MSRAAGDNEPDLEEAIALEQRQREAADLAASSAEDRKAKALRPVVLEQIAEASRMLGLTGSAAVRFERAMAKIMFARKRPVRLDGAQEATDAMMDGVPGYKDTVEAERERERLARIAQRKKP